jgi:hypothetical protein
MEDHIMSRHLTLSAKLVLGIAIAANIATASLAAGLAAMSGPRPPVVVLHTPRVARLNLSIASVRSIVLIEFHRNAGSRETPKFYSIANLRMIEKTVSRFDSASKRLTEKQLDALAMIYGGGAETRPHNSGDKCTAGDPHGLETRRMEKLRHRAPSREDFVVVDAGWWPTTCELDAGGADPLRAWAPGCAGGLSFEAVHEPVDAKPIDGAMD